MLRFIARLAGWEANQRWDSYIWLCHRAQATLPRVSWILPPLSSLSSLSTEWLPLTPISFSFWLPDPAGGTDPPPWGTVVSAPPVSTACKHRLLQRHGVRAGLGCRSSGVRQGYHQVPHAWDERQRPFQTSLHDRPLAGTGPTASPEPLLLQPGHHQPLCGTLSSTCLLPPLAPWVECQSGICEVAAGQRVVRSAMEEAGNSQSSGARGKHKSGFPLSGAHPVHQHISDLVLGCHKVLSPPFLTQSSLRPWE